MKTFLTVVKNVLIALLLVAAVGFFMFADSGRDETGGERGHDGDEGPVTVEIYGKEFPSDAVEIVFSGDEIEDLDGILEKLDQFDSLKIVDLGSFSVDAGELEQVREKFGTVYVKVGARVTAFGRQFDQKERDLDLTDIDPADVPGLSEALKKFPHLRSVDLRGVELSPELQRELTDGFPGVRFLWDVVISGEKYDSSTEDLDLSNHRELTLDDVRQIIPLFCGLKRLDLSDCGFYNEDLGALREEFPGTKIVWTLYMGKWSLKTDAVAFSVLIYNYNYTALTSADIEVLKYCTDLRALDLGHQRLTDLSVIGDYLPELRILILADNTVSDLTPLAKLKHLHYLELFVNPRLTDLSPIGACKEMVDLNISHIYGFYDISGLLDFPILERLWIENTGVSAADIGLLRATYPDANVVSDGWGSVDQGWRSHPRYFAMIDMYFDTTYISEEFTKYDSEDREIEKRPQEKKQAAASRACAREKDVS